MLFYCRFTWYPGTSREEVARRVVEQDGINNGFADRIKSWHTLVGGGAGFLMIEADKALLQRALINLLENATRHTPPGTPISVSVGTVKHAVSFAVHDDGPGIPLAYQPHLFEKFYRAPGKAREPGSGIGLAICKGLVEAHGGNIWVASMPGAGTTFTFTLPVTPDHAQAAAPTLSGRTA